MKNYQYLIIGGGMTAAAAVDGIREVDPTGSIGIVSTESDPPYNRPPLSKGLWKGDPVDGIWRKPKGNAPELHLGRTIKKIIPKERRAVDDQGNVFTYGKLLLATGGTPRRLPFEDDQMIYFRTLADYRRLRALTEKAERFAVIGGGFIGSEIAAALAMNGKKVTMIFPGHEVGERIFPRDLAQYVSGIYKEKGVELLGGEKVVASEAQGNQRALKTASGKTILVDAVVAGIGIEPNIELAESIGLTTEKGITVDEFLRTGEADIYAAGDVAVFYNPALDKRMRVEHEDNANTMGRLAGRNMAGKSEPYDHLPFFYSDMFELGYEAVGELDSRLETFADWKRPNEEGVVYYLRSDRVRGVLLWNVWGQVEAARRLIAAPGPFTRENLKGRLPEKPHED
ncbi:MAG: pyridine nucleotide-disulfide oxidoreductase [Chthoniobacterales bacterium]|nr:MAG: pyridine nucleotide-disulfide oxidoreductase [Chthoniobacterales bacterium]